MEFSRRKLPKEAAADLRNIPLHTLVPFEPVFAPTYVFLRANEKFISIKAPLDFFTPSDLDRLTPYESVFMPKFIDVVAPFRDAGRRLRTVLSWHPDSSELPPPSYELSDQALQIIGPLWSRLDAKSETLGIEPFFVGAFVTALCDALPGSRMKALRDEGIDRYEHAILYSSWVVFLALHLGHCDLAYLNALRASSFEGVGEGADESLNFTAELLATAGTGFRDGITGLLSSVGLREGELAGNRTAQKIAQRLARVTREFASAPEKKASVFGERGFADV